MFLLAVPAPSPAGLAAATRPPPSVTSRLTRVPAPVDEGLMPHDAEDGRHAPAAGRRPSGRRRLGPVSSGLRMCREVRVTKWGLRWGSWSCLGPKIPTQSPMVTSARLEQLLASLFSRPS